MMAQNETKIQPRQRSLLLWPGVIIVILQCLVRYGVPQFMPGFEGFRIAFLGGLFGAFAFFIWWIFFSGAPRLERWGALLALFLVLAITRLLNHESMGLIWSIGYALPLLNLALILWAITCRRQSQLKRFVFLAASFFLACGPWTLVRSEGMTGDHVSRFKWRWTQTAEERLLNQPKVEPQLLSDTSRNMAPSEEAKPIWPGFRGPNRDSTIRGIRIQTQWSSSPPIELWRRPIGPGWSSIAVRGNVLYTQEQRGEDELVSCYSATSGELLWHHRDSVRFYESIAGAGPRATPTLNKNRVYTLGATGILNALNADNGTVLWSRDLVSDLGAKTPMWGFASSPLVVDDALVVAAAGQLVAFDLVTGESRWMGPKGGEGYSSPQLLTIDGSRQIVLLNGSGAIGVTPHSGTLLWQSSWKGRPMIQPTWIADDGLLTNAGEGHGLRRLAIANTPNGWQVETRWRTNRFKPNFNDLVIHQGHAFGFDGSILACIDLEDGSRQWKGGRYGQGQLILLVDQGLLLVLSEKGELVLVEAAAERFSEIARFPAIKGKTWNHPVLAGDLLFVRNGEEMAAFRLALVVE